MTTEEQTLLEKGMKYAKSKMKLADEMQPVMPKIWEDISPHMINMIAHAYLAGASENNGCRWVRLSDNIPDKEVYIKGYKRLPYGGIYRSYDKQQKAWYITIYHGDDVIVSFRKGHHELNDIFYLDEPKIVDAKETINYQINPYDDEPGQ